MNLSVNEQQRGNKIRLMVKSGIAFTKFLKSCIKNIPFTSTPCEACEGTGLKNVTQYTGEGYSYSSWDCQSFCEECNGVGFTNWKIEDIVYACPKCNGLGTIREDDSIFADECPNCKGEGYLDWIQHAKGCV